MALKLAKILMILASTVLIIEFMLTPYSSFLKTEQTRNLQKSGAILTSHILNELSEPIYISIGVSSYIQSVRGQVSDDMLNNWLGTLFSHTRHTRNIGVAPNNIIDYIYPHEGNEAAIGLRYQDIKEQWPQIQQLMQSGNAQFIGPFTLVQGEEAFAFRVPVFVDNTYWGLISTIIEAQSLYEAIAMEASQIGVLRASLHNAEQDNFYHFSLQDFDSHAISSIHTVPLPSTEWQLTVSMPFDTAPIVHARRIAYTVLFLFLSWLCWLVTKSREQKRAEATIHNNKMQFLAAVSHELRTPLTVIQGALGMLASTSLDEEKRQALIAKANTNQTRLSRLIFDLLDMNLALNHQLQINRQPIDLVTLVSDIVSAYEEAAKSTGLHLKASLPTTSVVVNSDPERLRQVITHMLDNAIKFNEYGNSVWVSLSVDNQIRLSISDDGVGFPQTFLQQQSGVFKQHDSSDARKHGGTGIGLALCRELCELLDIQFVLRNRLPNGAEVELTWVKQNSD